MVQPFTFDHTIILPFVMEKYHLIQNSLAVKKVCSPKKAIVKKDVKSKVVAKKWL